MRLLVHKLVIVENYIGGAENPLSSLVKWSMDKLQLRMKPGACVIKLITTIIYLDSMVKP